MGTMGWKPSEPIMLGMLSACSLGGLSINMQRRMSEWQKKMVTVRRTIMNRIWTSWPRSLLVRANARSVMIC